MYSHEFTQNLFAKAFDTNDRIYTNLYVLLTPDRFWKTCQV